MSEDVECPYCGKWQEINHDDDYGYTEDETFEQECWNCDKVFAYTTSVHFYYEAEKAPCMNGGKHNFKQILGEPKEEYIGRYRCEYCAKESYDEEENKKGRKNCI